MYHHLPIFLSFQSTSRDLDLLLPRSSKERIEPELVVLCRLPLVVDEAATLLCP
jgi:hypothetical protein